jgi:hypothetical protein
MSHETTVQPQRHLGAQPATGNPSGLPPPFSLKIAKRARDRALQASDALPATADDTRNHNPTWTSD